MLYATDEALPAYYNFLNAPNHILGLRTEDAKLGVYSSWRSGTTSIDFTKPIELKFYDYSTAGGAAELDNTADDDPRAQRLFRRLIRDIIPNELQVPLPARLRVPQAQARARLVVYETLLANLTAEGFQAGGLKHHRLRRQRLTGARRLFQGLRRRGKPSWRRSRQPTERSVSDPGAHGAVPRRDGGDHPVPAECRAGAPAAETAVRLECSRDRPSRPVGPAAVRLARSWVRLPRRRSSSRSYLAQAKSPGETVLTWGYDVIAMGGEHLDKTILDKVSATQPILVWDASEQYIYANSAAIRKYKITKEDTKITGVMAGRDGEPNGQFLVTTAAQRILQEPLSELMKPEVALKSVRYLMGLSRQSGITTTSELAYGAINLQLEEFLFDKYPSEAHQRSVIRSAGLDAGRAAIENVGVDLDGADVTVPQSAPASGSRTWTSPGTRSRSAPARATRTESPCCPLPIKDAPSKRRPAP